jgi:hypothetical protein
VIRCHGDRRSWVVFMAMVEDVAMGVAGVPTGDGGRAGRVRLPVNPLPEFQFRLGLFMLPHPEVMEVFVNTILKAAVGALWGLKGEGGHVQHGMKL